MHLEILGNILGPDGLIIIGAVILVMLLGGRQLPKLARGLGSAQHEFRKGLSDGEDPSADPPKPASR